MNALFVIGIIITSIGALGMAYYTGRASKPKPRPYSTPYGRVEIKPINVPVNEYFFYANFDEREIRRLRDHPGKIRELVLRDFSRKFAEDLATSTAEGSVFEISEYRIREPMGDKYQIKLIMRWVPAEPFKTQPENLELWHA